MAIVRESIIHAFSVSLFLCFFVLLFNFLESLPTYCHDWPRGCHMEAGHGNSCSLCWGVPIGSIMYIRGWPHVVS